MGGHNRREVIMLIQKQLLEKLIELASDSAEYLNSGERWITVKPHGDDSKGVHVKVEDRETSKEAVKRKFSKSDDKKEDINPEDLLEKLIELASDSAEYLNSAEHWITVHPHGSDSKGQPLLVKDIYKDVLN